jgi:hypothetical protein
MIPTIGLMVGAYIVVRMLSFITRQGERAESPAVRIFAVLTLLWTLLCMYLLISGDLDKTLKALR